MDSSLILQNIGKHINRTPAEQKHFISPLQASKLKKEQFLLHENEVCSGSAFANATS
jgi:hypothetical protein